MSEIGNGPRVVEFERQKTDSEIAEELRKEFLDKVAEVNKVIDRANALGFVINYGTGVGPAGRNIVNQLVIAKHF